MSLRLCPQYRSLKILFQLEFRKRVDTEYVLSRRAHISINRCRQRRCIIRLAIRRIHRTCRIHRIRSIFQNLSRMFRLLFRRQLSQDFRRFQQILLLAFSLTMEEI